MSAVRPLLSLIDRINGVVAFLCGAALFGMCAVTLLQVLVRFALTAVGVNVAVPWSEEVARYLMIWIIFLGAAVACRHAQLISLEFVVRGVPAFLGRVFRYAALLICLAFFLLLIKLGFEFVGLGEVETSPVMSISKSWVYLAMPVGAILMIVNTLALLAQSVAGKQDIRFIGSAEATE